MKKFKIEIKWAIIIALTGMIWFIIEKLFGLHDNNIQHHIWFTMLILIPIIILAFLALKEKKVFLQNQMTWQQGFVSGIYISFFCAILNPIFQYIGFQFISPNFFTNMIEFSVSEGNMKLNDAQSYFNLKSYLIQGAFGGLSFNFIIFAIMAYFLKSK